MIVQFPLVCHWSAWESRHEASTGECVHKLDFGGCYVGGLAVCCVEGLAVRGVQPPSADAFDIRRSSLDAVNSSLSKVTCSDIRPWRRVFIYTCSSPLSFVSFTSIPSRCFSLPLPVRFEAQGSCAPPSLFPPHDRRRTHNTTPVQHAFRSHPPRFSRAGRSMRVCRPVR
jgi:hypothetical protein